MPDAWAWSVVCAVKSTVAHFEMTTQRAAPMDTVRVAMLYSQNSFFSRSVCERKFKSLESLLRWWPACFARAQDSQKTAHRRECAGTLEQVNGNALTVKTRNGITTIQLTDGAPIVAVTKGAMSDIKENSFVGVAAMRQPDGTIKAIEVSLFAESLRGNAEGHYPWDLMPNSTMTNAAVTQQVKKQEGNTLTLKYKDGEKTIVVPAEVTVVNLIPGEKADLKAGAKVFRLRTLMEIGWRP